MDSCIEDFSCKRKTNRYPLVVFFNILDIAILNSYLIARENREIVPKKNRQMYMKSLAEELAKENMLERFGKPSVYGQVKDSFHRFGMFEAVEEPDNNVTNKPGKCQMAKCRKSTRKRCSTCNKHVCKVHQKVVTYVAQTANNNFCLVLVVSAAFIFFIKLKITKHWSTVIVDKHLSWYSSRLNHK